MKSHCGWLKAGLTFLTVGRALRSAVCTVGLTCIILSNGSNSPKYHLYFNMRRQTPKLQYTCFSLCQEKCILEGACFHCVTPHSLNMSDRLNACPWFCFVLCWKNFLLNSQHLLKSSSRSVVTLVKFNQKILFDSCESQRLCSQTPLPISSRLSSLPGPVKPLPSPSLCTHSHHILLMSCHSQKTM